ncbi:hypothetical protein UFOVP204_110 [uncultured Caudovirales phage]|uniref:Uncharacterized protein n=1 Tax=uncultured Caudovirales phage TaxID=2100421 RepID=A0A6J7WN39_9CAUD|nr:hypothetical protein UFOVP204_110 [uncultured Caudovirales phage]
MKFYYAPIKEKVNETYLEKAGFSPFAEKDYELTATLVVDAATEEEAYDVRKTITNIDQWELIKTEE